MIMRQMSEPPPPATQWRTTDATVSAASLRHHLPDKALSAFERSLKHANAAGGERRHAISRKPSLLIPASPKHMEIWLSEI
jgi:hypothetical protein